MQTKRTVFVNASAVRFYLDNIRNYWHFEVSAGEKAPDEKDLSDATCDLMLDSIVTPLLHVSSNIYAYHNSKTIVTPPPRPPIPRSVPKHPSHLTIDFSKTPIDECRPFWRWALRGLYGASCNLVLEIPQTQFPRIVIAQNCYDPVIVTNLRAVVAPRAVSFCKRSTANGETVCCAFHRDAHHCSISFFGSYKFLSSLYRYCVKHCQFRSMGLEKELRSPKGIRFKKSN